MTNTVPTNDVDVVRAQVGHRQRELSEQESAHRLARTATGPRRNHRLTELAYAVLEREPMAAALLTRPPGTSGNFRSQLGTT